jgi:hypothetical protein
MEDAVSLATCLQVAGKDNVHWATRVHNKLRFVNHSLQRYWAGFLTKALLRFERVACIQLLGVLNHEMRQRSSNAKASQAKPIGLLGSWVWQHDPEQYVIENYSKALANLTSGDLFHNTNIPAGYAYQPWTIDGVLKAMEMGEEIVLDGDWD